MKQLRHYQQPTPQTGNEIRAEGTSALSEALKTNTTLKILNLKRVRHQQDLDNQWHTNSNDKAGNNMGAEGVCALSEALKVNTTLTTLNLEGEEYSQQQQRRCQ